MMAEVGNTGRLVVNDDPKRKVAHGLPPVNELATTLRDHLKRAGVKRASLHNVTAGTNSAGSWTRPSPTP